jgi:transcriptional regulator
MYNPESFNISDLQTMHADIEQWNFATLITPDEEGELHVTHLPLLLKRDVGQFGVLAGHMAKANSHWKAFNTSQESLAIFHGPHAYISPRWYSTDQAVPTWNYVVVHAFGMPRVLQGTENMEAHLRWLIHYHEGTGPESWRPEKLSQETYAALMKAIVCFEMPILRIEGKAKLGQNRSRGDILGLIQGLQATDRAANHELAKIAQSRALETSE